MEWMARGEEGMGRWWMPRGAEEGKEEMISIVQRGDAMNRATHLDRRDRARRGR